jgi:NitT/TauT family transport system substrate-binding protein
MKITVVEPFRSLFYAPQFVALHLGYFAAEDLEVTVRTGVDATSTTRALIEGTAQFAMGGIMRSLDLADRGGRFLPHFAEVNSRNGFFLLAREPRPGFAWTDLTGRTVISFAGAPTPWQCMLTVLRRHGVDPARVTFVRNLHGEDAVRALREGRGDFLEAGQPTAEQLVMAGAAHMVASMGEATGPVPFSSYMTTPDRLRREPELCERFTRAVHRAQRWIAASDGKAIAEAVAPSFPDIAPEVRGRAVERFRRQDTWASDPICRQPGYEYLVDILVSGGFIRRRHRYADLVDTDVARRVVAAAAKPGS